MQPRQSQKSQHKPKSPNDSPFLMRLSELQTVMRDESARYERSRSCLEVEGPQGTKGKHSRHGFRLPSPQPREDPTWLPRLLPAWGRRPLTHHGGYGARLLSSQLPEAGRPASAAVRGARSMADRKCPPQSDWHLIWRP
ncbi:hypothetical protein HispidOSU_023331 [Sigmodon hispidus]